VRAAIVAALVLAALAGGCDLLPGGGGDAGAAPGACPTPPLRAPDPERPRYRVSVRIAPGGSVVTGRTTVRFVPDRATDRIVFRLWPNGLGGDAAGVHLDAGPVTAAGEALPLRRPDATILEATPPGGRLPAGAPITLSVPWRLTAPGPAFERISRRGDHLHLGSFGPLLAWVPGRGWATDPPPRSAGESATTPAADWRLTVRAPAGLDVLATGLRAGGRGDGEWRARAMRDVAVTVGRFETARTTVRAPRPVRLVAAVEASLDVPPERLLRAAAADVQRLVRLFGPYPWRELKVVAVPDVGRGGIEYPGLVFLGDEYARALSHELAHQWFYSLVGSNQARDPWLDESLASFGSALVDGTEAFWTARPIPADARGRLGAPMTYWSDHGDSYFEGVYIQGVQALLSLGDPGRVACALRRYAAAEAYGLATPADLVEALRAEFPDARDRLAPYGVRVR
jgi:hypothetical protein